jgi:hypothetical protein
MESESTGACAIKAGVNEKLTTERIKNDRINLSFIAMNLNIRIKRC